MNRILADPSSVRFEHVDAVGRVLGVNFKEARRITVEKVLQDRAYEKAHDVAKIVQGTQGWEAAAVDSDGFQRLVEISAKTLLAGKKRNLWGEN